jgi:hypothetical protein
MPMIRIKWMRALEIISLIVAAIIALLWLLGLLIGVWLPDVVLAPRSTIAFAKSSSGHTFRVIQYWNRVDFYSTELHVTSPDGIEFDNTLDGDDMKSWSVPMSIDESNKVVSITLGGGRVKKVRYGGEHLEPMF